MKLSNTLMMNESLLPSNKKAFTLAEVLITLSILGVVAALTIPNLVNRQSDIAAQTKLKKAITNYHDVVEVYMIENETQTAGAPDGTAATVASSMMGANCANAGDYFKITERTDCVFKTADGARWQFDPITGNALVTDTGSIDGTEHSRYGVVLWNANGFVNSDQCNDNNQCGYQTDAPAYTANATAPTNGWFNAKEFITSTGAILRGKGVRATVAAAVAQGTQGSNTTTELSNAVAAP